MPLFLFLFLTRATTKHDVPKNAKSLASGWVMIA
jgi:hypothetical protein